MSDDNKPAVLLVTSIFLLLLGPYLFIWATNEIGQYLWPEKVIPFNFWTWAATLILYGFFKK